MRHARFLRENLRFCPEGKRKHSFSKSTNYRSKQFPLKWEIPSLEQSLTWENLSPFLPLGEIAKCRCVNRKTREINSSSEESEEDGDNGLEEAVEVEEDDDSHGGERKSDSNEDSEKDLGEEDAKDFDEKPKKKYGKGMKVLDLQLSHARPPPPNPPPPTSSLMFFWDFRGPFLPPQLKKVPLYLRGIFNNYSSNPNGL